MSDTYKKGEGSLEDWLLAKSIPVPESGCLLWLGGADSRGCGKLCIGTERGLAHRIAYTVFIGPIPKGLCVLHSCDVPSCINPEHLFLGTDYDNSADMVRKGRGAKYAKLSIEDVLSIRASKEPGLVLAERYRVVISTISAIKARKSWKWLDP